MSDLIWRCHICGRNRRDRFISVRRHEHSINGISYTENIRYCNDRTNCTEKSKTYNLFEDKK